MSAPEPVLTFAFEARLAVAPSERVGHGVGEEHARYLLRAAR